MKTPANAFVRNHDQGNCMDLVLDFSDDSQHGAILARGEGADVLAKKLRRVADLLEGQAGKAAG